MANTSWTKSELWAEMAALGEDKVRELLAMGHYGDPRVSLTKRPLVEEWLRSREESRRDASHSRQAEAASRAAAAAERQAMAAERANTRATIALVIAIISAIVSIITTLHGWR